MRLCAFSEVRFDEDDEVERQVKDFIFCSLLIFLSIGYFFLVLFQMFRVLHQFFSIKITEWINE